jgi:hypothetical protein
MPTQVFAGTGSQFRLIQPSGDPDYWETGHLSRGLATCDWNNDGKTDFVVTDLKDRAALLENRTATPYHWLQLELVGTRCERDAIGATARLDLGDRTLVKVVQTGDGYMSKNEFLLSFGLGETEAIERLEIDWPDGRRQVITGIAADARWLVVEGEEEPFRRHQPAGSVRSEGSATIPPGS